MGKESIHVYMGMRISVGMWERLYDFVYIERLGIQKGSSFLRLLCLYSHRSGLQWMVATLLNY